MDIYDNVISRFMAGGGGGGGGGGGLPTPTTEGAVLEVGSVADPSVVILPEQTVEPTEDFDYIPVGGNPSLLEGGMKVSITCNGETSIATVADNGEFGLFIPFTPWGSIDEGLVYRDDAWAFYDDVDHLLGDPLTISVVGVKQAWVEKDDPFIGFDLVVKLDSGAMLNNPTDDDVHLVKGTYAECMDKVAHGLPIFVYVYAISTNDDEIYYYQFPIYTIYADAGYHEAVEIRIYKNFEPHLSVRDAAGTSAVTIYGADVWDKTIVLYVTESGVSFTAPWN